MKKLLVLLSSVVAGLSLAGATFAAYAVNDLADPLGAKISPNGIDEEVDTYSTMTLEWGDKTHFTNIGNLTLTETREISVGVKSTVQNAGTDSKTGGNLAISLEDYTESHAEGAPKLVDNLEVHVYKAKAAEVYSEEVAGLALTNGTKSANADIATPVAGTEVTLYFTVKIKSGVSAAQYNQMQNDVVYLFADWGKPTGTQEVTTSRYFFKADGTSGTPNAYAYKQVGEQLNKNAEWPGEAMEVWNTAEHVYFIDVEQGKFDHIIFSYNGANQTDDLSLPAAGQLYNGSAWVNNTYAKDVVEPVYYLVGNMSGWDTDEEFKLVNPVNGVYTFDIIVPEGGLVYKVKEVNSNTWYSYTSTAGDAENCTWNQAGDEITITFTPAGPNYIEAH